MHAMSVAELGVEPPHPHDRRQEPEPGWIRSRWQEHGQQGILVLACLDQCDDMVSGMANRAYNPFFQDRDAIYNWVLTAVTR